MAQLPAQGPTQDPTQTGDADQDQGAQPVTVIEVSLMSDGTITVEQESGSQEESEEGSAGGEDSSEGHPTTVKDASEAGALVTQMLQTAGQPASDQAIAQNKSQQAAGYSQQ